MGEAGAVTSNLSLYERSDTLQILSFESLATSPAEAGF